MKRRQRSRGCFIQTTLGKNWMPEGKGKCQCLWEPCQDERNCMSYHNRNVPRCAGRVRPVPVRSERNWTEPKISVTALHSKPTNADESSSQPWSECGIRRAVELPHSSQRTA